jgi:hypothetical protein
MESNIQAGNIYDVGSIFAYFQTLSYIRKRRGVRYSLALILMLYGLSWKM